MKTKSTYSRVVRLVGMNDKSRVLTIPSVVCFRKGTTRSVAETIMKRNKEAIGFASIPDLHRLKNAMFCKFWCHCIRDADQQLNKPHMLLSESDFVDPQFIEVCKRAKKFKWDFYYFTSGGNPGVKNKGLDVFAKSLPILCEKYKLRGIVIKYVKSKRPFPRRWQRIINKYSSNLVIKQCKFRPGQVAKLMSQCRFGFFPNTADCSPLLLAESLVRDCPALVNYNIMGGWKYINDQTGKLFTLKDLDEKVNDMLISDFSPRMEHLKNYGFKKSAVRWANECRKHVKQIRRLKIKMLSFAGDASKMEKMKKKR